MSSVMGFCSSCKAAFSSSGALRGLTGVVMLCWVYGGGGACSVGYADDEAVYDGGSLRPCGSGVGSTDIWQYGQYVAKRGLSYFVRD